MRKYYTRPCNFYYGNCARRLIEKKKALFLAGNQNIAFDQIEIFLRKEIAKKFPKDGIVGEEFKVKKSKSGFSWIIDPIDGTRSFVIGSPTWSNLISVNYKLSLIHI